MTSEKPEFETETIHPELLQVPFSTLPETKVETNNKENSDLQKWVNDNKNTREEKTNPRNLEFPREHPPEYLNVQGWKDCLGEKQLESHSVICLPSEKPENCLQNSWLELIRIWTFEKEFEKCDESEEKIEIPGNLPIPKVWIPDYLNISDWKGCLGEKQVGSHSVVCFPSRPPPYCNLASWVELRSLWTIKYSVTDSEFETCEHPDHVYNPTEYLAVFGWFNCLGEKQNGSTVLCDSEKYLEKPNKCFQTGFVCLPSQIPIGCFESSWEKLRRIWASDPTDWEFGSTVGPHKMCDESEEKLSNPGNSWLPEPNEKKEIPQIMINKNQQVQLEG